MRDSLLKAVETYGTPLYIYDQTTILERCQSLTQAVAYPKKKFLYAMKANANPVIVRTILGAGFGLECVSMAEVLFARKIGAQTILYTNNNVSDEEFNAVVKLAISSTNLWINCDSLQRLGDLPEGCACFVRINGPVGGGHHDHVITCGPESKFGIPWEQTSEILKIAQRCRLKIVGIHQHIGSGILEVKKFAEAMDVLLNVARKCNLPDLEYVNFGGGIGVPYRSTEKPINLKNLGAMLTEKFSAFCHEFGRELTLMIEPGRFPVAESGYFVARVNTIKETPYKKTFVGVDSGFNHLARPVMYGSYHHISNLSNPNGKVKSYYIAGYICESGDIFTRADGDDNHAAPRKLPEARRGDLLALHTVGAYGYSMASEYNLRPRPAEVLLDGEKLALIRRAKTPEELANEALIVG
ncbi:MAG: diaminopimelate decarboxylase [Planctomycetota bacterium]